MRRTERLPLMIAVLVAAMGLAWGPDAYGAFPVLDPIADQTVQQGSTRLVTVTGSDADGDPVYLMASNLPTYASFIDHGNGSGTLTLAPTLATPTGTTQVSMSITDFRSPPMPPTTFNVTVAALVLQSPPVLAPIGDMTVAEGQVHQVSVSATDPDGGTLSWSASLPSFATFTPLGTPPGLAAASLALLPGTCHEGSYAASVGVSDGTYADTESFTITVTDVNRGPAWSLTAYAAAMQEGDQITLEVAASDPDQVCGQGAPILFLLESDGGNKLTSSLSESVGGVATLTLTAHSGNEVEGGGSEGVYHVTLRAKDETDHSLTSDVVVTVTVTRAPVVPAARAWTESDVIRLHTGKPRERFSLEPMGATFQLNAVDRASIRLEANPGAGSVTSITPLPESFVVMDKDGNQVFELRMEFAKGDLRALFSNTTDRLAGTMTLHFTLLDGSAVQALVAGSVWPEGARALRKVGPNPLNPEATISVTNGRAGLLRVRIFDVKGRFVRTLVDDPAAAAGTYDLKFNGRDERGATLPSGRYFIQVQTSDESDSGPLTIMK